MAANDKTHGGAGKARYRRIHRLAESAGIVSAFSGWADDEEAPAFTAGAMPRIRDSLVLRPVVLRAGRGRSDPDAPRAD